MGRNSGVRRIVTRIRLSRTLSTFFFKAERAAAGETVDRAQHRSTREAYALKDIAVKPLLAEQGLSFASLQANRATFENIRLWINSR